MVTNDFHDSMDIKDISGNLIYRQKKQLLNCFF